MPIAAQQYFVPLPPLAIPGFDVSSDSNAEPSRSSLRVFENGRPLGPAHSAHETIRTQGRGAFSHWGEGLHFSASDNSDPRTSGATYSVTASARPTPAVRTAAVIGLTLGAGLLLSLLGIDAVSASKTVALAWALILAPRAWVGDLLPGLAAARLAGQTAIGVADLAVVTLSIGALVATPFLAAWRWRLTLSAILLAGYVLDQAMRLVSGQPLHGDLVSVLISERAMAGTVLPAYLPTAAPALAGGLALLVVFVWPPGRRSAARWMAALPLAAMAGAIGLSVLAPGNRLYVPPPIGVPAAFVMALAPTPDRTETRAPVAYSRELTPKIDHLVVVIDESVRGDVMGINDARYGNTPFLRGLGAGLVNFGVATSATNCSVASRVIMRMGLRRDQLPDVQGAARRQPTIWQHAAAAGFRTSLLDAWARMHSYMDEAELAQVNDFVFVDGEEPARDEQLPALIAERVARPQRAFVYVNKLGIHPQYALKVPPSETDVPAFPAPSPPLDARRAADVSDYHRALRHSVDHFFERLWPLLDESTAVLYTSDHGQSLYEGGYDLSHCSLTATAHRGEVRVPLLVMTRNRGLQETLGAAAERWRGHADHYALFSTLLQLMGYAGEWADATFAPSLFAAPPGQPRTFLIGTYDEPGAYWVPYDAASP